MCFSLVFWFLVGATCGVMVGRSSVIQKASELPGTKRARTFLLDYQAQNLIDVDMMQASLVLLVIWVFKECVNPALCQQCCSRSQKVSLAS